MSIESVRAPLPIRRSLWHPQTMTPVLPLGTARSIIRRRLLVNYAADPQAIAAILPKELEPDVLNDKAMAGMCLLSMTNMRVAGAPRQLGTKAENIAHRFAVRWNDDSGEHVGVYISRRDTNSRIVHLLGGRIFPGPHQLAEISTAESPERLSISVRSHDGMSVDVSARPVDQFVSTTLFEGFAAASDYFEAGSVGFSPSRTGNKLEGVRLDAAEWHMQPVAIDAAHSTLLEELLPRDSFELDSGLLMTDLPAIWRTAPACA